jgi:polar amino acid transport system substrate-binding protein
MGGSRRGLIAAGAGALLLPRAQSQVLAQVQAQAQAGGRLVLVNTVYPPLVNPPGHASGEGVDIEVAREALRRGGDGRDWPLDIQWVPWKRALSMLELGRADFTTTVNHAPERERFLSFSTGYRDGTRYLFFTRRSAGLRLRTLSDLRGHRLALAEGFFYPEDVLALAAGNVHRGRDVAAAVQLVDAGRAEVAIVSHLAGLWAVREHRLAGALERQPLEFFKPSPVYMAFSRASTRAPAALAALNAGLASMRRDGSIARIERRYLR